MPAVANDDAAEEWFLNGASGSLTPWRANFPTMLLLKDPTFLDFLQRSAVATRPGLTGVVSAVGRVGNKKEAGGVPQARRRRALRLYSGLLIVRKVTLRYSGPAQARCRREE